MMSGFSQLNPIPAAQGGAGTISGALKGNGSGVVSQAGSSDLSDTTAPASHVMTDQSGAALTLTSVSVNYTKIGNIVTVYGTVTYPATADGTAAKLSLPVAVPNQNYATVIGTVGGGITSFIYLQTVKNTSTMAFRGTGGAITNVTLSTLTINFEISYPAS